MSGRRLVVATLALALGPAFAWWLHGQNARLRKVAANAEGLRRKVAILAQENASAEAVVNGSTAPAAALQEAKAELAQLERSAALRHAERAQREAALQANRDPKANDVLMEHFTNRGRATAEDAFQTMIWAAMAGDEEALAAVLDPPPGTADRRELLGMENMVTGHQAVRVLGYEPKDGANGVLRIRFRGSSRPADLAAHFDGTGWRIAAPVQPAP